MSAARRGAVFVVDEYGDCLDVDPAVVVVFLERAAAV
jgi:hypothetical protein